MWYYNITASSLLVIILAGAVPKTQQQSTQAQSAATSTIAPHACFHSSGQQCVYRCHCAGGATCDDRTGNCSAGCAPGWSGTACQITNVAVGKDATQTSDAELDGSNLAGNCVDGNDDMDTSHDSCCAVRGDRDGPVNYWEVDLGSAHVVERVVLTASNEHGRGGSIRNLQMIFYLNNQEVTRTNTNTSFATIRNIPLIHKLKIDGIRLQKIHKQFPFALCEMSLYGYQYTECAPHQGNYYYGPACVHQCTHSHITGCTTGQCNYITGARECTACTPGYYYNSSTKRCYMCESDEWGDDCAGVCNCKDADEACDRVDGSCPESGCADWYLDVGCDYALPRLGNNTVPRVTADGRTVTVQFVPTPAIRKRRAVAKNVDVLYRIQYLSLMNDEHHKKRNIVDMIWQEEADGGITGTVELPQLRERYSVCVVPYDTVRAAPGEPSACVQVYTQCVDGDYGSDCQHQCTCKDADEVCNKTTGRCVDCRHGVVGLDCKLVIPNETSVLVKYVPRATDIQIIIEMSADNVSRYNVTCTNDIGGQYEIEIQQTGQNIISGYMDELQSSTEYTCFVIPVLFDSHGEYPGVELYRKTVATRGNNDKNSNTMPVIVGTVSSVVALAMVAGAMLIIWLKRRNSNRVGSAKSKITGRRNAEEVSYVNGNVTKADDKIYENVDVQIDNMEQTDNSDVYQITHATIMIGEVKTEKKPKSKLPVKKSKPPPKKPSTAASKEPYLPIELRDFAQHIARLNAQEYDLTVEFYEIPEGSAPCIAGEKRGNVQKHRFMNIKAYDHSRVILDVLDGRDPDSDYINACYVRDYHGNRTMIASQAPRAPTIDDMWRMIWQEDINQIVMLTKLKEGDKVKCQRYWPEKGEKQYAGITVELLSSTGNSLYFERRMRATKGEETRMVTQLQYTNWPDHGVPDTAHEVLYLYYKVKSLEQSRTGRLLVHCSAGVGRTGTFIALQWLLEQSRREKLVDVVRCVRSMREDRTQMVQNIHQYRFLYQLLHEALTIGDTTITKDNYKHFMTASCYQAVTKTQLLQINKIYPPLVCADDCSDAMKPENIDKTRGGADCVPTNSNRVILNTSVLDHGDYINAVTCHTFNRHDLIMTQLPLKNTVPDMWRLVYDHDACGIVLLDEIPPDEVPYWPAGAGAEMSFGVLNVKFVNEFSNMYQGVTVRDFSVECTNNPGDERKVRQWHLINWGTSDKAVSPNVLKVLVDLSTQNANKMAGGATIVQCLNGVEKSSLYVAYNNLLEMMAATNTIDVCFVIRQIRSARPQAIKTVEELRLLYTWMDETLSSMQEYYN